MPRQRIGVARPCRRSPGRDGSTGGVLSLGDRGGQATLSAKTRRRRPGFLEAEGVDPSTIDLPAERCLKPAEGLAVVRALLTQLGALPEDPEAVAEDLREDEAVLSRLERARVRWHLGIDF